jgi:hypothetical protein
MHAGTLTAIAQAPPALVVWTILRWFHHPDLQVLAGCRWHAASADVAGSSVCCLVSTTTTGM